MRTAIIFEKRVHQGDIIKKVTEGWCDYPDYKFYVQLSSHYAHTIGSVYLAPGTYTITAENDYEDLEIMVCAFDQETAEQAFPAGASAHPAEGYGTLPYTFTVSKILNVYFNFYSESSVIDPAHITEVRIHDVNSTGTEDVYAQAVMHPEEIADVCTIKQEINCITGVNLRIFPGMEAWRFCERSVTYVRVFDLDRTSDRMIFKGRVTAVTDRMERGGKMYQDVTCASGLDFLRDTTQGSGVSYEALSTWLTIFFKNHDDQMDDGLNRKLIYTLSAQPSAHVSFAPMYCTKYEAFMKIMTGGEDLRQTVDPNSTSWTDKMELRERCVNDLCYIDIAPSFGERKSTPIKLGENLGELQIERGTDGGIYTAVTAVSGTNSDGNRYYTTRLNPALAAEYGTGRTKIVVNDSIRCTAPMEDWIDYGSYVAWEETEANKAMQAAIQAVAVEEAAKLSVPPARITLSASDLSAAGMTGYEPFECYNSYPLIHPDFYLHGQYVRVYAITRRLSDGKIESMTVGTGEQPPSKGSSMSALLARLDEANRKTAEKMQEQLELVDAQIEEQTGGTKIAPYTKNLYNKLPEKDEHTLYVVDDGTDVELWYGDRHITTGGGEGQTIECAAVLSSEEMTEWAPDHELVPVTFRGSASVYYGQPPARFVVQGQRAVMASSYIPDDITSEIVLDLPGGYREKYTATLTGMRTSNVSITLTAYDVSGATEILIGTSGATLYTAATFNSRKVGFILSCSGWQDAGGGHLAPQLGILAAAATNGTVNVTSMEIPYGSHFANPVPVSTAEEGFGTAITRKTEPSGGGDE